MLCIYSIKMTMITVIIIIIIMFYYAIMAARTIQLNRDINTHNCIH